MNATKRRYNIVLDKDLLEAAQKRGKRLRKPISEMVREQFVNWYTEEQILAQAEGNNGEKEILGRIK